MDNKTLVEEHSKREKLKNLERRVVRGADMLTCWIPRGELQLECHKALQYHTKGLFSLSLLDSKFVESGQRLFHQELQAKSRKVSPCSNKPSN